MTKPTQPAPEKSFVASKLPWLAAAALLIVYALTLNRWVSLNNLPMVARSAGWMWGPELANPLFYLLTYPFRWIPAAMMPMAFNLFALACGILSIALLARSVALLPCDRTADQRSRERSEGSLLSIPLAWIPPVFAVLACGLQLTVWEANTSGASDVLDVLLLAYIIRNLLEYRIDGRDSWLFKAALVCGAGMANHWLLFVLFPGFLISVIWIKGLDFFNARFLLRIFLCGVAGTLLYLLLPAVHVLSSQPIFSFWEALKSNLAGDKQAFMHFAAGGAKASVLVLIAATSLLPLILIGIRWPSNFGDPSRMGSMLTAWIFHLVHGGLLVLLLWVAFDPMFSPRRLGYALPALTYLSSLAIGYLAGYFLLVFRPLPDRMGRTTPFALAIHKISTGVIVVLFALVPVALLAHNLPQVRMTNGPALREYARELAGNLPENAAVLSDDGRRLFLTQAADVSPEGSKRIYYDTQMARHGPYHGFQEARYGDAWPLVIDPARKDEIKAKANIDIVLKLAQQRPLSYLHPSFGYFFELFDGRPNGLTLQLTRYSTNSLSAPPLSEAEIARNEAVWTGRAPSLERLAQFIEAPQVTTNVTFTHVLRDRFKIPFQPNVTAIILGRYYSQSRNFWGVQLQRSGRAAQARPHFVSAIELFPGNLAAKHNLAFNSELVAGHKPTLRPLRSLEEELGAYRNWEQVIQDGGPFDSPTHCFALGLAFAQGGNFRQATHNLERVHELVPENIQVAFWLSRLYVITQQPEKALDLLASFRNRGEELATSGIRKIDLLQAEAGALYVSKRTEEADRLLRQVMNQATNDVQTLATVVQIATVFRSYTNALAGLDRILQLKPNDIPSLVSKGVLNIQAGRFQEAIEPLSSVLSLQSTNHGAKLYRAVAYLGSEQLDKAEQDYLELQKVYPNSNDINTGLAEVALKRQDTNTAVKYLEICLRNTPVDSELARILSDRINKLKNPPPP